jgi:fatty acid-binding protein DegV
MACGAGRKQEAVEVMLSYVSDRAGSMPVRVAVLLADVADEAEDLMTSVAAEFDWIQLLTTEFTPATGEHAGPGVLGPAYFPA